MDAEIAALLGFVGAVWALVRWLLAAALDILVATQCGLPAILLAAMATLVHRLTIHTDAIGTGDAAIAAAPAIITQGEFQIAKGLMSLQNGASRSAMGIGTEHAQARVIGKLSAILLHQVNVIEGMVTSLILVLGGIARFIFAFRMAEIALLLLAQEVL